MGTFFVKPAQNDTISEKLVIISTGNLSQDIPDPKHDLTFFCSISLNLTKCTLHYISNNFYCYINTSACKTHAQEIPYTCTVCTVALYFSKTNTCILYKHPVQLCTQELMFCLEPIFTYNTFEIRFPTNTSLRKKSISSPKKK